jgi:hypothetical protein
MMDLESLKSFSSKAYGRVNEFSDFPKLASICVHLRFIFFLFSMATLWAARS